MHKKQNVIYHSVVKPLLSTCHNVKANTFYYYLALKKEQEETKRKRKSIRPSVFYNFLFGLNTLFTEYGM